MHAWHSGRQCSLASALRADLERTWFRSRSEQSLSVVHVEQDVRLLVHGDDFMVEMPTHEEKWFESVSFSKYDGKCAGCDGIFVFEPCDPVGTPSSLSPSSSFSPPLSPPPPLPPPSGWAELEADTRYGAVVLRDLGLGEQLVVTHVTKRPKSEELL